MGIHFFDTARRDLVEFEPREPGRVYMYVCGPTPYDVPHMGHGRTAITFDMIRRYFRYRGYEVHYASNVTDIEDKIIKRAAEENTTEPEIVKRYEKVFHDLYARLNIEPPDHVPHATEYITQMVALIEELVEHGSSYEVPGNGVYFAVEKFAEYGSLSHRKLDDLLESAGARVEIDEEKKSPIDFALWKAAKPGEPSWESPWGEGRPGWHIECSAMSLDLFGEMFDIHGGGTDLTFPHHENEIAQALGAGHEFSKHWIHSAMLNISGEKMSKSLGNFITLQGAIDAHGPRALRLLALQTHYRTQMELSDEALAAAASAAERLDAMTRGAESAGVQGTEGRDQKTVDAFVKAMDDDFNSAQALGAIFDAVREANTAIASGDLEQAGRLVATVNELTAVLGVPKAQLRKENPEVDALVRQRDEARESKDWAEADRIRDELTARGITLEDTPGGTIWHEG